MMNEKFYRYTTTYGRKVINKFEKIHQSDGKYKLFYKYINALLKEDLKKIDSNSFKYQNVNKRIPFRFWIMWWQGIDNNTPEIISKNIKNIKNILGEENVVLITKFNYKEYTDIPNNILNKVNEGKIDLTNFSDIIRFNLLRNKGGYWIDSTVIISPTFKEYIRNNENNYFFSLCESRKNYHNISYNQWTIWLIGGAPHYRLFEYVCNFYNNYFYNHDTIIDYFLTDDIISHFYNITPEFRDDCERFKKNWQPYYWGENFNKKYDVQMINKFNNVLEYSVQKLTYKFNKKLLKNKDNLLCHIFTYLNSWENKND